MKSYLWSGVFIGLVLLSAAAPAAGDTYVGGPYGVKITSLPYTISSPGAYYLGGNLSYSGDGDGITINSDDVTLDLMGYSLTYTGSATENTGVLINERQNVEIRNGTLSGWYTGIYESYGNTVYGHRVINVRVENNSKGVMLGGFGHLIEGCRATAGSTPSAGFFAYGMILGCMANGYATGAGIDGQAIMKGNVVSKSLWGISGYWLLLIGNSVSDCNFGIFANVGEASIIGNTVNTSGSSQYGIFVHDFEPNPILQTLIDQNTVTGPGTHYFWGSGTVQWRNNAGYP
jgi:hypothetical protein